MKYRTEDFEEPSNERSAHEGPIGFSWLEAQNAAVDAFAEQMKKKLRRKAMSGKQGWDDPRWPRNDILRQLIEHVEKGDMVDVANFALFAWNQES